jgi:uncharacterized protein YdaU (DUF1376 family)
LAILVSKIGTVFIKNKHFTELVFYHFFSFFRLLSFKKKRVKNDMSSSKKRSATTSDSHEEQKRSQSKSQITDRSSGSPPVRESVQLPAQKIISKKKNRNHGST